MYPELLSNFAPERAWLQKWSNCVVTARQRFMFVRGYSEETLEIERIQWSFYFDAITLFNAESRLIQLSLGVLKFVSSVAILYLQDFSLFGVLCKLLILNKTIFHINNTFVLYVNISWYTVVIPLLLVYGITQSFSLVSLVGRSLLIRDEDIETILTVPSLFGSLFLRLLKIFRFLCTRIREAIGF